MAADIEATLYAELKDLPRPQYPFADLANPLIDDLAAECDQWIDADCPFESIKAREAHKRHRFGDIAARAYPSMTIEELRPISRFSAFFAIIDDYLDHSSNNEVNVYRSKTQALLSGEDQQEPETGFYHQVWLLRQDAMACKMPQPLYEEFIDSIMALLTGYIDEKRYISADKPPPLPVYNVIRQQSSGSIPFAKYLCMQKNYRQLPLTVLRHPIILRLHDLLGTLVGYHNDFVSLPKELARKGDVINLVMTIQSEMGLDLISAYKKSMEIHDDALAEFVVLQKNLPDFGEWQSTAEDYVEDLGVALQGIYAWHIKASGRYVPGGYVEPQHKSQEFTWDTQPAQ